jgi:hypothetical protein
MSLMADIAVLTMRSPIIAGIFLVILLSSVVGFLRAPKSARREVTWLANLPPPVREFFGHRSYDQHLRAFRFSSVCMMLISSAVLIYFLRMTFWGR